MTDEELGRGLTCFIVGPIGDRLEPLGTPGRLRHEDAVQMWANVLEPACRFFGMQPVRADKISESGEIPEQIFTYLRDADVVIADLTGGNANVMYELGLRHTREKITIQIGEHERLPFDVNTIRTVKFKRTEAGLIDARNALIEALRSALKGKGTPVTATRVWNASGDGLKSVDVARAAALSLTADDPADLDEDNDNPGKLELMAEGEAAMLALGGTLEDFTSNMVELGETTERFTPEMTGAATFAQKLTIMRQLASALKEPSTRMDETSGEYLQRVEQVDAMLGILFRELEDTDPADPATSGIDEFTEGVIDLRESAFVASVSFTEMLPVVRQMRGWSNFLKPVAKSIEHSVNTILRGNVIVATWADRMEGLRGGSAS